MQSAPKVTSLGLSVKLPIVSLRLAQRHSKALNGDASKLHILKYYYTRPPPKFRAKSPPMCIFSCVNVCFHAGLPQSLSIIRLYEKIGFELVALFKSLQR